MPLPYPEMPAPGSLLPSPDVLSSSAAVSSPATRRRHVVLRLAALLCGAIGASNAAADPIIFQTAIQRPADPGGSAVFDRQFIGAKFFVNEPTETTRIGGHFTKTLDVFGALVRLSNAADFPDSADLSTPDVLGAARILSFGPDFSLGTGVFSQSLSVSLDPGWYALVFGSGRFGTEFSSWGGSLTTQHERLGNPRFFISSGLDPGSTYRNWSVPREFSPLLFVEGTSTPAPVPEPGTMLLVGTGAAALVRLARRYRG